MTGTPTLCKYKLVLLRNLRGQPEEQAGTLAQHIVSYLPGSIQL